MRARTLAQVSGANAVTRLHCEPPLTLRRVGGVAGECALCLVGTAAGPLAGDDLRLDLCLDAGADVTVRASGASIAQGAGDRSLTMSVTLGAGSRLVADPGPLIVGRDAHVQVAVTLDLAADAQVEWRELVVLGRSVDQQPGTAAIGWDVVRDGRPLLRQLTDLADPALRTWRGATGGHRVIASVFRSGPDVHASTRVLDPAAVVQALDPAAELVTVLGDDAADVTRRLAELRGPACLPG